MGAAGGGRRAEPPAGLPLVIHVDEAAQGERYWLGIEAEASQVRVGLLSTNQTPNRGADTPFTRSGFYSVGLYKWPHPFAPQLAISQDDASKIVQVAKQFLAQVEREKGVEIDGRIDRIQATTIVSYPTAVTPSSEAFPSMAQPVETRTNLLSGALRDAFPDVTQIGSGIRSRYSAQVEYLHGAGQDIRPNDELLYITISRNLNLDLLTQGMAKKGVYAPGVRHSQVDLEGLRGLGRMFIGADYDLPKVGKCPVCHKQFCLSQIASGQAMAEFLAADQSAGPRPPRTGEGRVVDAGGEAAGGVDGFSVNQAAYMGDAASLRIVKQAGIALGLAIHNSIFMIDPPNLIVIGGAVPMGSGGDDALPIAVRPSIDGTIEQVLNYLGHAGAVRVTRSRFAGFTGLLGTCFLPLTGGA